MTDIADQTALTRSEPAAATEPAAVERAASDSRQDQAAATDNPDNAPQPGPSDDEAAAARQQTRRTWLVRLAILVAVAALLGGLWYLFVGRHHVSTDDAYVTADVAEVTPLIASSVVAVHVEDTQFVKAGSLLVELDPADARVALEQAQADLSQARRKYRQSVAMSQALGGQVEARNAGIAQANAQVVAANADAAKARLDLQRRETLAASGAVSGQELSDARKAVADTHSALVTAQSSVAQAQSQHQAARGDLAANDALVTGVTEETDPGVLVAKAKLAAAQLDMTRLQIRAPIDGVISRRNVQLGQRLMLGSPVMTIVPVGQAYVDANFKEGQLRRVRIGMPAEVVTDLYGSGVVFHGRVAGIGGGTGSATAIIPAQNATGNWIKVVQRLPVRIDLDPKDLAAHPLRLGLSTDVTINLDN